MTGADRTSAGAESRDTAPDGAAGLLGALFRRSPLAAIVLDPRRRVAFASPGAESLLEGAVRGVPVGELVHPEDRDRLSGHLDRCLGTGQACLEERYRARRGDGWDSVAIRPVDLAADPAVGGPVLYVRREGSAAGPLADEPRRSEALLTRVISHVPVLVYVIDADGIFRFSDGRGLAALGLAPGEVVGRSVFDLYAEWPDALDAVRRTLGGEEVAGSYPVADRYFDTRMTPILEGGRVAGLLGISLDITEREERAAHARLQARLLEHVGQAVVATDPAGRIIFWNPAAEELFGWPAEEALGRDVQEVTVAPSDRQTAEAILESLRAGERWEGLYDVRRRDGSTIPAYVTNVPLLEDGEVIAIVGVTSDFTERQALEAQLRQAQKLEAVGRLAGGIAHDFNNLLTSVAGYADLASRRVEDDPQLAADLGAVVEAAERGRGLADKLLAFSRQSPAQPRPVDVNDAVRGLAGMLDRGLGDAVRLELELDEPLWPARIDPFQLEQNILNLVLNARDAMSEGGVITIRTDRVTLTAERAGTVGGGVAPGDYVRVRVSDTGSGIPEALRDRVFEPFFTTKEVGKGSGLGLSIVYGSVTQAGGAVELEHGDGTTAVLYLPRAAEPEDSASRAPEPPSPAAPPPDGPILLVEDEPSVRELARRVLERAGYRVVAASNGEEARVLVEQQGVEPALVLTDVIMPEMAGPELIQRLRSRHPAVRSVFMSGYTANELTSRGLDERQENFLPKPFTPAQLLDAVRRALSD